MTYTHDTVPTQFVEANGIRFAYRRFGKPGTIPLVFNQHYTGTMDYWDPAVTDGLAKEREIILFNNAGVSNSSGETPSNFQDMGPMPSPLSARWALRRWMFWVFRSAASWRRKSRCRAVIWCGR
jgi:pimeloyl-ACP methyl ester carboxylesterase